MQSTFEIRLQDLVLRKTELERKKVQYNVSTTEHYWPYFGIKVCHPGYEVPDCEKKMNPANPYWVEDCPNLLRPDTFHLDDQFIDRTIGGIENKRTPG